MADPQVKLDDLLLDNGSWRRIVGNPAVLLDRAGVAREFHVELLIEGDTADERLSRFQSTFDDYYLLNARLRVWFDTATTLPTLDWHTGDGKTTETVATVSMLPEESQTQGKLHCIFSFIASTQIDYSEVVPSSDGIEEIEGLAAPLELSKMFMDSEKYTLSVKGTFKSTLNESAEGPYNLESVSNNSGKARFTLESPDVIIADYDDGMYIDVDSGDYAARHFISAISGGGAIIDTTTDYAADEGDVGATILVGTTSTAEDNFAAAKNNILTNLLETDTAGRPNSVWPYMTKLGETLIYTSTRKDQLEFVLVSGPSALKINLNNSGNEDVARGLNYTVRYEPAEMQDTSHHGLLWNVIIDGQCAINDPDEERDLATWYDDIELAVWAEVESIANARIGGRLRKRLSKFGVDYATGDTTFTIVFYGNYSGTVSYSRSQAIATKQPRTIWRDTDGNNPTQSPKGPPDRGMVITVNWLGDAGGGPSPPPPPSEGGFKYIYDGDSLVANDDFEDSEGNRYSSKRMEYTYTRIKPVAGGGGGGSGGKFDDDGYYVPTSPDI